MSLKASDQKKGISDYFRFLDPSAFWAGYIIGAAAALLSFGIVGYLNGGCCC